MRTRLSIKATLTVASLMVVALWIGYAVGYSNGVRAEQRNWWSSLRYDSEGNRVFLGPEAVAKFDDVFARRNAIPDKLNKSQTSR